MRPLSLTLSLLSLTAAASSAQELSFNKDIRPILSENCLYCHGQDRNKRKGELRLDDRAAALEKKAYVPGDAAASELVKRILSSDPDELMPPPDSHRRLSAAQRETLQKWIAQGANYETQWTFVAPVRPVAPEQKTMNWARNDIDRFVLAKMEEAGLAPSPEADRATIMRRLHMDLTGLPPEPAEVDAFMKDAATDAYEKLVEQLLASPHYGERMALPWLDAARFADSNGFQQDGDTHQYIWRDWVVKALNADMPFDRFSIEQLAGDLLENPAEDQLVATAFNRNHLNNGEGGNIAEEQRNVILFDRVDTTATTWLGLTMACAQCHDHKYDPITMRDYYSMMALFNNVPERGTPPGGGGQYRIAEPMIAVGTEDNKVKLKELEAALAAGKAEEQQLASAPETLAAHEPLERELLSGAQVEWAVLKPAKLAATGGPHLTVLDDQSIFADGPSPDKADYTVTVPAGVNGLTGLRIETIPDARLPKKGAGRGDSGNAVLTRLRVTSAGAEVRLNAASATYTQGGFAASDVLDADNNTGWAFYPETQKPYSLVVQLNAQSNLPPDALLEVTLEFQSQHRQHTLGRFRISSTASAHPVARNELPDEVAAILKKPDRSKEDGAKLRDFVSKNFTSGAQQAARAKARAAERALHDYQPTLPRVMVMSDKQPRKTHILDRGDYLSPREEVSVAAPAFLPPLPEGAPRNRLGFAQWLFRPEHPLTARVHVNRLWQYFFGTGLVKTSEDLGVQSEVPVHGPLLDWLAVEFREKGWSQKHMVRLILNSSTYRQSSRVKPEHLQRDPENRLMARASRFRLPSLLLRDAALAASGLLNDKMFGKPVYPYQPDAVWETLAITKERDFTYPASSGPDLYRRSLYTFWRRTIGPVNMFDASSRQACKVRSVPTSTPLHALTTLNDITWTEAARVLAEKALKSSADATERINWAFRRIMARPPSARDLEILSKAFNKQLSHYRVAPAAAESLLKTGTAPRDADLAPDEHAAMTAVCIAVFNLDEALTRQ